MLIQELNSPNRVLETINSIKNLWLETYSDLKEGVSGISFGSNEGYVVYNYETTKPFEIVEILERINNEMAIFRQRI